MHHIPYTTFIACICRMPWYTFARCASLRVRQMHHEYCHQIFDRTYCSERMDSVRRPPCSPMSKGNFLTGPTCLIWSNLATAVQGTIHFSGSTTGGMEVSSLIIFSRSHCCIIPRLLSATSILGKLVQISGSKFPTLQADVGCQLWAFGSLPARWLADGREGWRVWARLPLNLQDVSYVSS